MFAVFVLSNLCWILMFFDFIEGTHSDSDNIVEKKKRATARAGYYGGVGYPYPGFAEPMTILAGLAFLAFIVQMFHAVYHTNHGGLLGGGGGGNGGLLGGVLPSKTNKMLPDEEIAGKIENSPT